jgi:MoaA/NifB/PqqE/SkfB family radical SAM enzyme
MQVIVDDQVQAYFKNTKQVFLYVTDECNLCCEQCLYKPLLTQGREIKYEVAVGLLDWFRGVGAIKLSILGGEPTRYSLLGNLVRYSKEHGYEYVRMDTNGVFPPHLLQDSGMRRLDELSFSLDGHTAEIDESMRGVGSFSKCVSNIKRAVAEGYRVDITCCVHRNNCGRRESGESLIEEMIQFATELGVTRINLHPLLKMGIPRDVWAGETDIAPATWLSLYRELKDSIDCGKFRIPVRVPERFTNMTEFAHDPTRYGYCPVKLGERALIHPNGEIRACALMIGTPYALARWEVENNKTMVRWNTTSSNEIRRGNFNIAVPTPCTNQQRDFGQLVPLCISFKPRQDEFLWTRMGRL